MERILANECLGLVGKKVKVAGWLQSRRLHGKLIFFDVRDRTGLLQLVIESSSSFFKEASKIPLESVVEAEGAIVKRPKNLVNPKISTGTIELQATNLKILSEAAPLPFEIAQDTAKIKEETRLEYRYLDLRTKRLQKNLKLRQEIFHFLRNWFKEEGFWEIETPILTRSTPEGARDFVVPSRLHPSKFYALPQSPQQYKQLLMVAGFERYFQIVRCFRDEDPRADRQPEFTQLDIEMSFVDEEEIFKVTQDVLSQLIKKLFPKKKLLPFKKLTFGEAMSRYRTDKPDLRTDKKNQEELSFVWLIDFPMFEWKPGENRWGTFHHPFTAIRPEDLKLLDEKENLGKILARQYDLVLNGFEIGGGSIRETKPEILQKVFQVLGHKESEVKEQFGHLLNAFEFGVPPHGGIALGLDRIVAILAEEPKNIREVIAFPKTGDAFDPMMKTPSPLTEEQLKELRITIDKK